jgi:hypothetical protein
MDTGTTYYCDKDPQKVPGMMERLKKKKYLQPCLDQQHHLTRFLVLADGLVGKEARMVIKTLADNQS